MEFPLSFRRVTVADTAAINALLESVAGFDGRPALSEHKMLHRAGDTESREVIAVNRKSGAVIGYGQAAWHHPGGAGSTGHWAIEVTLHPEARTDANVDELLGRVVAEAEPGRPLTAWAWDRFTADAIRRMGWTETRAIDRVERSLPIPHRTLFPEGVHLDRFRVGVDEAEWLTVNNAAFDGHPENGALTLRELKLKQSQPWFEAAGLLMARSGGRLLGSCWTKMHPGGIGEIYIVGVHPEARGRGIGKALIVAGLEDLFERRDATTGMIHVDEANEHGVRIYRQLGFRTVLINREYEAG